MVAIMYIYLYNGFSFYFCRPALLCYPRGYVGAVQLFEMDTQTLEGGQWLNDAIVDFYLK